MLTVFKGMLMPVLPSKPPTFPPSFADNIPSLDFFRKKMGYDFTFAK